MDLGQGVGNRPSILAPFIEHVRHATPPRDPAKVYRGRASELLPISVFVSFGATVGRVTCTDEVPAGINVGRNHVR